MAWLIDPLPPVVIRPAGSLSVTEPAPSMSSVMAMISASILVALGHMSRWRMLTWAKCEKASVMKL